MLEGGNEQLTAFFDRHEMGGGTSGVGVSLDRYKTKAASFYRQHLMSHAKSVAEGGLYEGREASRKSKQRKKKSSSTSSMSSSSSSCATGNTSKRKKNSRESLSSQKLATVTEKELVENACGVVGA